MQRSLVHNAIKPCSRCKETLFATQTNLHWIHLLPIHKFATETIANHSSHPICKDTTFHHPFASFPPTFLQSTMPPMHFGCTSITKYTRRTTSQLPHTQPQNSSTTPQRCTCVLFFENHCQCQSDDERKRTEELIRPNKSLFMYFVFHGR